LRSNILSLAKAISIVLKSGEFTEHADGLRAHSDPRNLRLVRLARRNAVEAA